jgi:type IV pilus assembly protein PilW
MERERLGMKRCSGIDAVPCFPHGFTLVELLIYVALSGLIFTAVWQTFNTQNAIHNTQKEIAAMEQNLRAAMFVLKKEIRMAGYNPTPDTNASSFGITDIRLRNENNSLNVNGNSAIGFTAGDYNNTGVDKSIFFVKNGPVTLARAINTSGRQLFAENIEALELAYAFDADGDGILDTSANGNIIWAVDTDNDNRLDLNLDTNDDGIIDDADDTESDGRINGIVLNPVVDIDKIRAVHIWILGVTTKPDSNHTDNGIYGVGRKVIRVNDRFHRRQVNAVVKCRNLGL